MLRVRPPMESQGASVASRSSRARRLGAVDWVTALAELRRRRGDARTRHLANAASLSALFLDDFAVGDAHVAEAIRLEPLNPLHRARHALHLLRFGQHERALACLDALGGAADLPTARIVRALATLMSGEERRAANIARDVLATHPKLYLAGFLQADAHLKLQLKETEARAMELPRDPAWATAWAHLLAKLAVARPREGAKTVKQHLDVRPVMPKGSPQDERVRRALAWSTATPDALERELAIVSRGSRAEELVVALLSESLRASDKDGSRLRALHRIAREYPERPSVRRLYVSALTRHAIDEAAGDRWPGALRAVEACIRLEPHEPTHVQNRAAIFTAMADDAYQDAWADLDRLNYRLALMGQLDPASARRIAKPHRMFAQQARQSPVAAPAPPASIAPHARPGPEHELGVFRRKSEEKDGVVSHTIEVNQARLDADPEQLRQWIHHRRAELVFSHLALGDGARQLLHPPDPETHAARVAALSTCARSLGVLVQEEGTKLAELLAARWRALPAARTRYAEPPDDPAVTLLEAQHVETLADLAMLGRTWTPPADRADLVEDLIESVEALIPFFDARALAAAVKGADKQDNTRFLASFVRWTLRIEDGEIVLTGARRRALAARVASELLVNLAEQKLAATKNPARLDFERILDIVDRARRLDPEHPKVEFSAARLFTIGEFYDDARAAIARFHKIAGGKDTPYQKPIEEMQKLLDDKKKAKVAGHKRQGAPATSIEDDSARARERERDDHRTERLEAEIERFPSSVQLYEELAHALCFEQRFDAALSWTTRAIGRCLTRKGQLRARALQLEVTGLRLLAATDFEAARVYLAGSRSAALPAIERIEGRAYALEYLRGMCLLASKRRADAELAFRAALLACPQQLHRAVLKPLAEDVEQALVEQSRAASEHALAAGNLAGAMAEIVAAMADVRAPESCLVDVARIELAAVVAALGASTEPAALPRAVVSAAWSARLADALARKTGLERARAVALLADELFEPSRKECAALLRKIDALEIQLAFAASFSESARLQREGKFAEALAVLDRANAEGDPRALRQRVALLLRLDRFAEADVAFTALAASGDSAAREMIAKYPELRFRYGLAAVNRHLRANDTSAANAILDKLAPTTPADELEKAYAVAFSLAREGYRHHEAGASERGAACLTRAIDVIEGRLDAARSANHARLIELRDRLDTDLARMQNRSR